ncbi:MAG TPA: VCBS repeat-containing protein [Candidatus Didemnitutus sp.]|nr:VCBS repeat-containing protein [Candidatus Didemnitutus sp.]
MNRNFLKVAGLFILFLLAASAAFFGIKYVLHSRPAAKSDAPTSGPVASSKDALGFDYFTKRPIGRAAGANDEPWITDLEIVDLDGDGLKDVLVCDGCQNRVSWIRQVRLGVFEEQDIGQPVAGPAHVDVADLNGDGHLDVLVASMGVIPPSNVKTGAVVVLVNDGTNHFTNRVLLEQVARVTYVTAADLNKDGKLDLVVGQFGYLQGEIRWMENRGNWQFESHQLLDLPGTIHAPVADLTGTGNLDIVALVAQDSEEVHAFMNDGHGRFRDRVLYGSTNKDYGSSGLTIGDVNKDGRPDIVYTNGDGFDYATPGSRPWHGVQWLENLGEGKFAFHRVGDFPGAFSPVVADLNGDGLPDLVASSCFNDWNKKDAVSLMCFENDGAGHFIPRPLAHDPTHIVVVRAADLFNDGRIELVTGSFMFYPPFDRGARIMLWEHKK